MSMSKETKKANAVPLWVKPTLSIAEATVYSGISREKLYELTDKENCPFVLWLGNKRRIKRVAFDQFILDSFSF